MAMTINSVSESRVSTINRNLTQQTAEQANEQPEQTAEVAETQVERTDTVEITSNRNTARETEAAPPPEPIDSAEAALNKVDAILGWRVFHYWNPDRMRFVPIAPERIPRISYIPISIPVYTRDVSLSEDFIQFTLSPKGRAIYEKYGYLFSLDKAKSFAPRALVGGEYVLPSAYFDIIKNLWKRK